MKSIPCWQGALVVKILSKMIPLPWELRKWNDPNSTWSTLFSLHALTLAHSNQAKQFWGALIHFAFIYICESGFSEMLALTQIFIINSRPKMTYMLYVKVHSTKPKHHQPNFGNVLLRMKIYFGFICKIWTSFHFFPSEVVNFYMMSPHPQKNAYEHILPQSYWIAL